MNWTIYAIFVYVFLAVQTGFAPALELASDWRYGPVAPRFELILVVFVGLLAARGTTIAAWVIVGALVDLLTVYPSGGGGDGLTLIGPYTLGFLVGALVLHQIRGMVLRTHPLSMAFCVFVCGLTVSLVVVALFTIRSWYDGASMPGFSGAAELFARILSTVYTAALALLFAWPLLKTTNLLGLQLSRQSRR